MTRYLTGRRGAVTCFVLALASFGVQSIAWPLYLGRDAATYLLYYADMWNGRPAYPELMLFRTPLAPLAWGVPLQVGGPVLAEILTGIAFAVSVVAFAAAASEFGTAAGVFTAVALLVYPSYGALFEGVSSDSVFAFVLALWVLGLVRAARAPSLRAFGLLGVGFGVLVLARPSALLLAPFLLVPLILPFDRRNRIVLSAVAAAAAAAFLVAYAGYNAVRYSDFVISRTTNAHYPLYRLFVSDHLVSPSNGPATRKLAAAVRRDLLTTTPYKQYGITLNEFFADGTTRTWADLVPLVDREWGWSSDYAILRSVAIEAIEKHPGAYARDVSLTVRQELTIPFTPPRPVPAAAASSSTSAAAAAPQPTIVVHGRTLPKPSEDDLIPASRLWWLASTPDGRIHTDFADLAAPTLVWNRPADQAHADHVQRTLARLESDIPDRAGSAWLERWFQRWLRLYPRPWMWLVAGLVVLLLRRPRRSLLLVSFALMALDIVVGSAIGEPAFLQYAVPIVPLAIMFFAGALLAPRDGRLVGLHWPPWWRSLSSFRVSTKRPASSE